MNAKEKIIKKIRTRESWWDEYEKLIKINYRKLELHAYELQQEAKEQEREIEPKEFKSIKRILKIAELIRKEEKYQNEQ